MCGHRKGESYPMDGAEKKTCTAILDDPMDAYEFSFVAVPAQRKAGASKNSAGAPQGAAETPASDEAPTTTTTDSEKAAELAARARLALIFANTNH
jgi:hypothetical protein